MESLPWEIIRTTACDRGILGGKKVEVAHLEYTTKFMWVEVVSLQVPKSTLARRLTIVHVCESGESK